MAMNNSTQPTDYTGGIDELDPTRLGGHTLDELEDYLASERIPPNPSIEASAGCQLALDALERLRRRTMQLLEQQAQKRPEPSTGWIRNIMDHIAIEAHAGRDIPILHATAAGSLILSEGAVRGIIRAAGDSIEGVIVGRCRLAGDITVPAQPVTVDVDITVQWGENLPSAADRTRAVILRQLLTHTELTIAAINVTVQDVRYSLTPRFVQEQAER